MTHTEAVKALRRYFNIKELVSANVYLAYGERAWSFFDTRLIETLLFVRKGIGKRFYANNWFNEGKYDERGLRSNMDEILRNKTISRQLYLSSHVLGMAIDFTVEGMEAEEVRDWIESHAKELPYKVRLEWKKDGVPITWVHLDVRDEPKNPKVYKFDV